MCKHLELGTLAQLGEARAAERSPCPPRRWNCAMAGRAGRRWSASPRLYRTQRCPRTRAAASANARSASAMRPAPPSTMPSEFQNIGSGADQFHGRLGNQPPLRQLVPCRDTLRRSARARARLAAPSTPVFVGHSRPTEIAERDSSLRSPRTPHGRSGASRSPCVGRLGITPALERASTRVRDSSAFEAVNPRRARPPRWPALPRASLPEAQ